MPQKKSSIRRSGKSKARTNQQHVAKFAGDAYSVGERALKGLNALRRLINIETKSIDVLATTAANSTPSVVYLSGIDQGVTSTTRVGNSLRLQQLAFDWLLTANSSATIPTYLRLIMFRDNENAGAAPAFGDLIVNSAVPYSSITPYTVLNLQRFGILMDECITLGLPAADSIKQGHYRSAHNGHVIYRGVTSAAASAGDGSIWMLIVSNQPTNAPAFTYGFRMAYTDD